MDLIETIKYTYMPQCTIFAYHKIRSYEFDTRSMNTILQLEYSRYKFFIKSKMRNLFARLLKDGNCNICYADRCDCSKVIPKEEAEYKPGSSGNCYC